MKTKLAEFIIQACERNKTLFEYNDMPEIREGYSGRGSEPTTAVVCDNELQVLSAAALEAWYDGGSTEDLEDLLISIASLKVDDMGRRTVLY